MAENIEYIDGDKNKGIKLSGEIMRSIGYGWILCKRPRGLMLELIVGGGWFIQKQIYLQPNEIELFEQNGREYIDELYTNICNKTSDYECRYE